MVGLEDFPISRTMVVSKLFTSHLDALRRRFAAFQTTKFVVAPECNMGRDSSELAQAVIRHGEKQLQHRGRLIILDEDETNWGMRTGGRDPVMSKDNLQSMAAAVVKSRKLRFHTDLVSVCGTQRGVTREILLERFVDQLQRYGADVKQPSDLSKAPTLHWHGKRGAQCDDLAMVFQLNLAANILFMRQPGKYDTDHTEAAQQGIFVAARPLDSS